MNPPAPPQADHASHEPHLMWDLRANWTSALIMRVCAAGCGVGRWKRGLRCLDTVVSIRRGRGGVSAGASDGQGSSAGDYRVSGGWGGRQTVRSVHGAIWLVAHNESSSFFCMTGALWSSCLYSGNAVFAFHLSCSISEAYVVFYFSFASSSLADGNVELGNLRSAYRKWIAELSHSLFCQICNLFLLSL